MILILYYKNKTLACEIYRKISEKNISDVKLLHIDKIELNELSVSEYIYAEWGLGDFLLKNYWGTIEQKPMAFYNEKFIEDIDDCQRIIKVMQQATIDNNWDLCKSINEFLKYGDLIRKRAVLKCLPSKIQIESTDLCNAKCIMCSHAYEIGSGIDLFASGILDELREYFPYIKEVVLHGNGEPFIAKTIIDYLKVLGKYNIKFIANTNLSVVSNELLEILDKNFIELNISCDGHNKELYETIRAGLSFDAFVNNLQKVREQCPNLYMKLNTVVMRQNIPYLENIVIFAAKMGFAEVVFNMLCVDKRNNNLQDSPLLYADEFTQNIRKAIKRANECGIKIVTFTLDNSIDVNNEGALSTDNEGGCDWLVEGPYINLHGQVAICCMNQNMIMGRLRDNCFGDIWNGDAYQSIRARFYKGEINKNCFGCDFILQNRMKYMISHSNEAYMFNKQEREIHRHD